MRKPMAGIQRGFFRGNQSGVITAPKPTTTPHPTTVPTRPTTPQPSPRRNPLQPRKPRIMPAPKN
jgi:hypothetical protein